MSAKYTKELREKMKINSAKQKQAYARKYDLGPVPEQEPERSYQTDMQKYCAGYDPSNIACVSCYENQVAAYKRCKK